jgi:HSP20 family protein
MLMRTDPFRDLDRLTQQLLGAPARAATMPLDAYRLGDEFLVQLDLPGVDASKIELTVEQNVLTITAERKTAPAEGVQSLISERTQGVFTRQLFLGDTLDADRIRADYTAGVLTLTMPVAEQAKPRRIEIEHSEERQTIRA